MAQLLAALGFPIICIYTLCKRRSLTAFHLMGLTLSISSWLSIGFFVSFAIIPYPVIFFGVQPGFVAVQALAIIMSILILLWISLMLLCWMKNDHCTKPWLSEPNYVTLNHERRRAKKRSVSLFPLSLKGLSKGFLIFWFLIVVLHIIGIPGFFVLNLLNFHIW